MRRCNQVVSILLLLFSAWVVIVSRDLVYSVEFSPGAGFFPFWLGVSLFILSLILLVNSTILKFHMTEGNPFPGKQALLRLLYIMGSLLVSMLLFERLGFLITMGLYGAFLFIYLEKYRWYSGIAISAAMVLAVYGVFKIWLDVPLPPGLLHR